MLTELTNSSPWATHTHRVLELHLLHLLLIWSLGKEMMRSKSLSFLLTSVAHTLCGTQSSNPTQVLLFAQTPSSPPLDIHSSRLSKLHPSTRNQICWVIHILTSWIFICLPIQANGHPFIPIPLPLRTASSPMLKELWTLSLKNHFHLDDIKWKPEMQRNYVTSRSCSWQLGEWEHELKLKSPNIPCALPLSPSAALIPSSHLFWPEACGSSSFDLNMISPISAPLPPSPYCRNFPPTTIQRCLIQDKADDIWWVKQV